MPLTEPENHSPPAAESPSWVGRIAARLFTYEPIGRRGVTYLDRWVLARLGRCRVYLHRFRFDDPEEPHNHPRTFVSFLFWGAYDEEVLGQDGKLTKRTIRAPYLRRFPPSHAHRITACRGAWSLVAVGPRRQDWGFYNEQGTHFSVSPVRTEPVETEAATSPAKSDSPATSADSR